MYFLKISLLLVYLILQRKDFLHMTLVAVSEHIKRIFKQCDHILHHIPKLPLRLIAKLHIIPDPG